MIFFVVCVFLFFNFIYFFNMVEENNKLNEFFIILKENIDLEIENHSNQYKTLLKFHKGLLNNLNIYEKSLIKTKFNMEEVKKQQDEILPFLEQFKDVSTNMLQLVKLVDNLDIYSLKLEDRVNTYILNKNKG